MMNAPEAFDLIRELPVGTWAAISVEEERIVSQGLDMETVLREAKEAGVQVPLMMCSPESAEVWIL